MMETAGVNSATRGKRGKGVAKYLENAETLFVRKVIHKEGVGRRKGGLNRT